MTSARWPHQVQCLQECRAFLNNASKRDFFVQIATGGGKSLIMADLLSGLAEGHRACVIVPKLDLMEQVARLLESLALPGGVSRVGTGHAPDLEAQLFVCVRNSAWLLAALDFELLLLDEAHHYEPSIATGAKSKSDVQKEDGVSDDKFNGEVQHLSSLLGPQASTALSMRARKRIFFSATLRRNQPDFDFGLREAVRAGVISDYTILVPFITAGDPKPSLVELIQDMPTARRILAFCNTVHEAKHFTELLNAEGVPAGHYNGGTAGSQRAKILERFEKGPGRGGIRVLVTVDVLSEGVDLPMSDTCMFVEPRRGLRLRQCVGRVLRRHLQKVDALVVSPPIVQKAEGDLVADAELIRLLSELASADDELRQSLAQDSFARVNVVDQRRDCPAEARDLAREEAAKLLATTVYPQALSATFSCDLRWQFGFAALKHYVQRHGDCAVPLRYRRQEDGFGLGPWVSWQRIYRKSGDLAALRVQQLDTIGFDWEPVRSAWNEACAQLHKYKQLFGHTEVPQSYVADNGFKLGFWVKNVRSARRGKLAGPRLDDQRANALDKMGFVWEAGYGKWEQGFRHLEAYKAECGNTLVPFNHVTLEGFNLGAWVAKQCSARCVTSGGGLDHTHMEKLEQVGFVWESESIQWKEGFQHFKAYIAEHGDTLVPSEYSTADGFELGAWTSKQRSVRRGADRGGKDKLDRTRIEMLEQVGFVWEPVDFKKWEQAFKHLEAYKATHDETLVPYGHVTADGFNLGSWVSRQRAARRGTSNCSLDGIRIELLEQVGFIWEPESFKWEQGFQHLEAYKAEHGDTLVPRNFITAEGFNLGTWVSTQRAARRGKGNGALDAKQIEMLAQVGFIWEPESFKWEQGFQHLEAYKAERGDTLVPRNYVMADGFHLGSWVRAQHVARRDGALDGTQTEMLAQVGFIWEPETFKWEQGFRHLEAYKAERGDTLVPYNYFTVGGFNLGAWVGKQRLVRRVGDLQESLFEMLEQVGFSWVTSWLKWERNFRRLEVYKAGHGDTLVPRTFVTADGFNLGAWVSKQRSVRRGTASGKLDRAQIEMLEQVGFAWEPGSTKSRQGFRHLED
ncbi:unnamed protein product [Polarella glacialis]|uniref:Helicase n=1 Tax=Polarella glacialis TaxID=89957 RepID=A0A813KZ23_POLGL|nr:unnamed protein product [Polarella glacialis]